MYYGLISLLLWGRYFSLFVFTKGQDYKDIGVNSGRMFIVAVFTIQIEKHKINYYSNDMIHNTVIGLLNLDTDRYDAKEDIASSNYSYGNLSYLGLLIAFFTWSWKRPKNIYAMIMFTSTLALVLYSLTDYTFAGYGAMRLYWLIMGICAVGGCINVFK